MNGTSLNEAGAFFNAGFRADITNRGQGSMNKTATTTLPLGPSDYGSPTYIAFVTGVLSRSVTVCGMPPAKSNSAGGPNPKSSALDE